MRLNELPGAPHLSYCTNIHAGESWEEVRASLDAHVPGIKAASAPTTPFGIGLRLSEQAARTLADEATLQAFRAQLARLGAYVFTINAFPYGRFHGTRVKERVYLPDWREDARVDYTLRCATLLAGLLPDGVDGSISTVPGAFKDVAGVPDARAAICRQLARTAAGLVEIERRSGRRIALALEPEPCCLLETVAETQAFFESGLLARASLAELGRRVGASGVQAEALMRRHVGVCYDVCHAAVEFEEPVAALRRLRGAGIAIPKIQLSCALRLPAMHAGLVPALRGLDDGVYLHQVVVDGQRGELARFVDIDAALAAFDAGGARGEWRIHCHVPIYLPGFSEFESTRPALRAVLAALRDEPLSAHLEVETYTWDVLAPAPGPRSKVDAIAAELAFASAELRR